MDDEERYRILKNIKYLRKKVEKLKSIEKYKDIKVTTYILCKCRFLYKFDLYNFKFPLVCPRCRGENTISKILVSVETSETITPPSDYKIFEYIIFIKESKKFKLSKFSQIIRPDENFIIVLIAKDRSKIRRFVDLLKKNDINDDYKIDIVNNYIYIEDKYSKDSDDKITRYILFFKKVASIIKLVEM